MRRETPTRCCRRLGRLFFRRHVAATDGQQVQLLAEFQEHLGRIADGTYKPHSTDRTASFVMLNSVAIAGGFRGYISGTNDTPFLRNMTDYETILSGDINTAGVSTDNSYSIVRAPAGTDNTAILDGVTVTEGNNSTRKTFRTTLVEG